MQIIKNIFSIKKIPVLSWSSSEPLNLKPKINTFIFLTFGLFLFGLGETILIASSQGVSPWTVFAQGISINTNFSIGFATFIVSVGVLLIWIPLKQKPGIGTILNAIIISIVLDYSYPYLPKPDKFFYQILQSFIGVLIVGLGSGFYLIANLGPGPRDGLMTGIQKISKLPIYFIGCGEKKEDIFLRANILFETHFLDVLANGIASAARFYLDLSKKNLQLF